MSGSSWQPPTMGDVRRSLGRFLRGDGLEIGPGHNPFQLPPGASVKYVDRWQPDENRSLFPELDDPSFPTPDVVSNLDLDRLGPFADASVDFVIASHVLEHVADPLGLFDDIHRVLQADGVAIVLLPDRRRTFDRERAATPLDHLLKEFEERTSIVSDAHIEEFLLKTNVAIPSNVLDRERTFELHRRRSIHVHCWHEEEFLAVILYAIEHMGHRWEFLDGVVADDEGDVGHEFGWALRKSSTEISPTCLSDRFQWSWSAWTELRHRWHARGTAEVGQPDFAVLAGEIASLKDRLQDAERALAECAQHNLALTERRAVRWVDAAARRLRIR